MVNNQTINTTSTQKDNARVIYNYLMTYKTGNKENYKIELDGCIISLGHTDKLGVYRSYSVSVFDLLKMLNEQNPDKKGVQIGVIK